MSKQEQCAVCDKEAFGYGCEINDIKISLCVDCLSKFKKINNFSDELMTYCGSFFQGNKIGKGMFHCEIESEDAMSQDGVTALSINFLKKKIEGIK